MTGVWVIDILDYFLISAIMGSLLASRLKEYLSEEKRRNRLKNSIIKKSNLVKVKSKAPVLKSKKVKIEKIYQFALSNRCGNLNEYQIDPEFSNETFKLAASIKVMIERLAFFLKQKELKGFLKIFYKSGELILDLILYKCRIDITYVIVSEGLNTRLIIMTMTTGGTVGFTLSWLSAGIALIMPPVLTSLLFLRSLCQNFSNQKEFSKFKKFLSKVAEDSEMKKVLKIIFSEDVSPTSDSGRIKMKPFVFNKDLVPQYDYNLQLDQSFNKEFIKDEIKKSFGLIENPNEIQIKKIIRDKIRVPKKGKTVLFRDIIDKLPYESADLSDSNLIDAEILEQVIRIKSDNKL